MKAKFIIYSLVIAATFTACKKEKKVTPVTDIPVTAIAYYSFNLDGTPYSQTVTKESEGVDIGSTNIGVYGDATYGSSIGYTASNKPSFYIGKGTYENSDEVTDAQFKAFFAKGTYNYAAAPADGIVVSYYDAAGTEWSTKNSPATQTEKFTITNVVATDPTDGANLDVTATFNCTLYDGLGHSKKLTAGKFLGEFYRGY